MDNRLEYEDYKFLFTTPKKFSKKTSTIKFEQKLIMELEDGTFVVKKLVKNYLNLKFVTLNKDEVYISMECGRGSSKLVILRKESEIFHILQVTNNDDDICSLDNIETEQFVKEFLIKLKKGE